MPPFLIDGIRYHNHDITILWNPEKSDEAQPDNLKGYRVYIDGKLDTHIARFEPGFSSVHHSNFKQEPIR